MSTLVISGTPDLSMEFGTYPYAVDKGWGASGKSYRRQTADSPFVHGRFLVGAIMDVEMLTIPIFVQGTSAADLKANIENLVSYFSQWSYTITYYEGNDTSAPYSWTCEIADYTMGSGGEQEDVWTNVQSQTVTFSVPCNPVTTGPW